MKNRFLLWKSSIFLAVVLLSIVLFFLIKHARDNSALKPENARPSASSPLYEAHDRSVSIYLKAVDVNTGKPTNINATIRQSKSRYNQMKQAVLAFLQGPRTGKFQIPVPEGIGLNEFYLTKNGMAVVDLSMRGVKKEKFGFYEETLFVRGLIEVLSRNFFEVRQVKILVDGQDKPTLTGHYALGTSDVNSPVSLTAPNGSVY
jgi:hypothetical protein